MAAGEIAQTASTTSISTKESASRADRRSSDRLSLSTRFTLALGFGGLLAIMAVAGIDGIRMSSTFPGPTSATICSIPIPNGLRRTERIWRKSVGRWTQL